MFHLCKRIIRTHNHDFYTTNTCAVRVLWRSGPHTVGFRPPATTSNNNNTTHSKPPPTARLLVSCARVRIVKITLYIITLVCLDIYYTYKYTRIHRHNAHVCNQRSCVASLINNPSATSNNKRKALIVIVERAQRKFALASSASKDLRCAFVHPAFEG